MLWSLKVQFSDKSRRLSQNNIFALHIHFMLRYPLFQTEENGNIYIVFYMLRVSKIMLCLNSLTWIDYQDKDKT